MDSGHPPLCNQGSQLRTSRVGRGDMNAGLCPVHGHHIPLEPLCGVQQSGGEGRPGQTRTGQAWRENTDQTLLTATLSSKMHVVLCHLFTEHFFILFSDDGELYTWCFPNIQSEFKKSKCIHSWRSPCLKPLLSSFSTDQNFYQCLTQQELLFAMMKCFLFYSLTGSPPVLEGMSHWPLAECCHRHRKPCIKSQIIVSH